jgi:hypothetical protein
MIRFAIALLAGALSLAAQSSSSLQGVITDSQGAAIPEAVVTAKNQGTSAERRTVTNRLGEYGLLQMQPGIYIVSVEKPGFRMERADVTLQVDTPFTFNLKLEVGQVSETVNVTASATVVNTENASVGNPFTETQIKEIPLQTRNVVALLSIQPGVTSSGQVVGSRPDQNNVLLDGVDVNDNQGANGFNAVLPIPLDSVQEFRTTVAGLGADLGRSAGGQVAIVTKGGTNQFHGSLYEYNRNTDFSANNWFSNRAGTPRAALNRNQYGASLGGPILKKKVFFFFNYEGRQDRSATAKTATVPSATFRQGIVEVQEKTGQIVQLSPSAVAAIDPLHQGENAYIVSLMQQYPQGNDPLAASDKGLNFNDLLFNASNVVNDHAMVGRMDYNIDAAGKHTLMVRGTLNGAAQTGTTAQFPGQAAASESLDNSRGVAARYTAVLSAHLVNNLNYGYTRLGNSSTGNENVIPSFGFTTLQATTRPSQRDAPTTNITDDLTWTKGRHTIQVGVNLRFIDNDKMAFNNEPSYSFNRNTLLGLGNDIDNNVTAYLSGAALSSTTNVTNAFGAMLGIVNNYGATYNYLVNGQAIAFGQPLTYNFGSTQSEEYAQDTFRWKQNFTITLGLRYSLFGVPHALNGQQVIAATDLNQYFAQRVGAQAAGVPGNSLSDAFVSWEVGGPENNGPNYYPTDKKDLAPRAAIAYVPAGGSMMEKILGKSSVFRAGAGIVYDNYGSAMVQDFATSGSPGLASTVAQPVNTNFTTSFRYGGSSLPALPTLAGVSFNPTYTPPLVTGGFTTFEGVASNLKAPYEYTLSANYARPIPHKMTLEVGYLGRLGHRGLLQSDIAQPLTQFKDTKSGQTWAQASTVFAKLYDNGLTAAQVKANPSLAPNQPFFENIFPGAKNEYITGSASANYFYDLFGNYSGSDLDAMNDMDRIRQSNGGCISLYGCNTFYPMQDSGLETFVNAGKSAYHAATVVLRRAVQHGWGYDFNYTFSHSIDNGSASETSGGAALQDAFNPNAYRGPSDFDQRHTVTADAVIQVPVGKGKALLNTIPKWLDYAIGGWQVATLVSYHSGNPLTLSDGGVYNVNYEYSAFAILRPGSQLPANGLTFDQTGSPSILSNTSSVNSFVGQYPGTVGTRGILRGPGMFDTDLAVSKSFRIHESHRISVRGEAFNAFNNVQWNNPTTTNLSINAPTTFGEITSAGSSSLPARVMQFALRYEF